MSSPADRLLVCSFCGRQGTRAYEPTPELDGKVWCSSSTACRARRRRLLAGRGTGEEFRRAA